MLRLNRDVSKADRLKRVEEMLEFVSLHRCLYSAGIFFVFSFLAEPQKGGKNPHW